MSEYVVELPESGAADECIELHALDWRRNRQGRQRLRCLRALQAGEVRAGDAVMPWWVVALVALGVAALVVLVVLVALVSGVEDEEIDERRRDECRRKRDE